MVGFEQMACHGAIVTHQLDRVGFGSLPKKSLYQTEWREARDFAHHQCEDAHRSR
ncbi:MAG: hypothetical protein K2Y37_18960 [Pirellulales bacterium]|nr:hypothetical protein [Pirellulales bacterium]